MAFGVQVDATGVRVGASGVVIGDTGDPCCCEQCITGSFSPSGTASSYTVSLPMTITPIDGGCTPTTCTPAVASTTVNIGTPLVWSNAASLICIGGYRSSNSFGSPLSSVNIQVLADLVTGCKYYAVVITIGDVPSGVSLSIVYRKDITSPNDLPVGTYSYYSTSGGFSCSSGGTADATITVSP